MPGATQRFEHALGGSEVVLEVPAEVRTPRGAHTGTPGEVEHHVGAIEDLLQVHLGQG